MEAKHGMFVKMCRGKVHRATVTEANLHYVGSITLGKELLEASGILPGEAVQVLDVDNGLQLLTAAATPALVGENRGITAGLALALPQAATAQSEALRRLVRSALAERVAAALIRRDSGKR